MDKKVSSTGISETFTHNIDLQIVSRIKSRGKLAHISWLY